MSFDETDNKRRPEQGPSWLTPDEARALREASQDALRIFRALADANETRTEDARERAPR